MIGDLRKQHRVTPVSLQTGDFPGYRGPLAFAPVVQREVYEPPGMHEYGKSYSLANRYAPDADIGVLDIDEAITKLQGLGIPQDDINKLPEKELLASARRGSVVQPSRYEQLNILTNIPKDIKPAYNAALAKAKAIVEDPSKSSREKTDAKRGIVELVVSQKINLTNVGAYDVDLIFQIASKANKSVDKVFKIPRVPGLRVLGVKSSDEILGRLKGLKKQEPPQVQEEFKKEVETLEGSQQRIGRERRERATSRMIINRPVPRRGDDIFIVQDDDEDIKLLGKIRRRTQKFY
jgi:hypothetical protein